jgi:glycosyltransferase involved in cell wall biosynthesis
MTNPLISILIPLYNAERFIEDTIRSVLNQSYGNLEIIITDDRSIDTSVSKVLQFKDSRIRLIVNENNLGPEKNWNKALSEAKGKYIKLVCCDDLLERDCIEKQVAILENPWFADVGLVSCSRFIITAQNRKIMQRSFGKPSGRYNGRQIIKRIIRSGNNPVGEPVAGLFRSDAVKKIGGYRVIAPYAIDLDFWIRLLAKTDIYIINEPLCSFRISSQSWSARLNFKQLNDYLKLIDVAAFENAPLLSQTDILFGRVQCYVKTALRILFFRLFL